MVIIIMTIPYIGKFSLHDKFQIMKDIAKITTKFSLRRKFSLTNNYGSVHVVKMALLEIQSTDGLPNPREMSFASLSSSAFAQEAPHTQLFRNLLHSRRDDYVVNFRKRIIFGCN